MKKAALPSNPSHDTSLLVQMSPDELVERVALRVAEMIAAQPAAPEFVDRATLARELGVSTATVSRLRAEGAPHVVLGDVARFRIADVVRWLEHRSQQRKGAAK